MKRYWVILLFVLVAIVVGSCGDDQQETEILRPQLSHSAITMTVGDIENVTVSNAQKLSVTVSDENIVSASILENVITVKALNEGNTKLKIVADNTWLQCPVCVVAEDAPFDFDKELDDATTRYVSGSLSLIYDNGNPGIIFSVDNTGTIEILSLDTGAHVVFSPGSSGYSAEVMVDAELTVNGIGIALADARVERYDNTGVWLNLTSADTGEHIVLVVTDL